MTCSHTYKIYNVNNETIMIEKKIFLKTVISYYNNPIG